MGHLLRPGMHLMRRLSVAGKFALIAVLLLMPLGVSASSAYREASTQVKDSETEQNGLKYTTSLIQLYTELLNTRNTAVDNKPPEAAWASLVKTIDEYDTAYGVQFDAHDQWRYVRADVYSLYTNGHTYSEISNESLRISELVAQMIKRVTTKSLLIVDPDLDSHYLIAALTDRLPRVLLAISDAHVGQQNQKNSQSDLYVQLASTRVTETLQQLLGDLSMAYRTTQWTGLRDQVADQAWITNNLVANFTSQLTDGGSTSDTTNSATDNLRRLTNSVSAATSTLISTRHEQQVNKRSEPLSLTLIILTVVGYLLLALSRATTKDVRTVLEEINTVTSGGVHQTTPLEGSDEFSQMSRAVVYTRDKLTALVGALKYQATHDELTSLANRALFTQKVDEALARPRGDVSVVLLDLDGFKNVNDSFGHDLGDRMLRMVGARIHRTVPRGSVIARLGSDEFAILLPRSSYEDSAEQQVQRLQEALAQPLNLEGRRVRVLASVGIAESAVGSVSAVEMVRNADVALNYAKTQGKGICVVFEESMHEETKERADLSADLVQALERDELRVVYQPLVDMYNGHLHGVEALVRWDHPTRGTISPAVFIPLAEASGLIAPIGRWVLRESCAQLKIWQDEFPDRQPLVLEVNVSPEQLSEYRLVPDVLSIIEQTGIDPTNLVLEITESALAGDIDTAQRRLGQLSAVGLDIALDDFGTGYSSLSYLRRLPVNVLKIDKSFVGDDTPQGHALLHSITGLGSAQGMRIVAEGIETHQQAAAIRAAGVHVGQGYLWSRPVAPEVISDFLQIQGSMPTHDPTQTAAPAASAPTVTAAPPAPRSKREAFWRV